MANVVEVIAGFIFVIVGSTLLFQCSGRYIYNYRITESGIEVVLLGTFLMKRVPFSNIADTKMVSFKERFKKLEAYAAASFGNRVFGPAVLVLQKKALFKTLVITPDNPEQFVHELLQHLPPASETRR